MVWAEEVRQVWTGLSVGKGNFFGGEGGGSPGKQVWTGPCNGNRGIPLQTDKLKILPSHMWTVLINNIGSIRQALKKVNRTQFWSLAKVYYHISLHIILNFNHGTWEQCQGSSWKYLNEFYKEHLIIRWDILSIWGFAVCDNVAFRQ